MHACRPWLSLAVAATLALAGCGAPLPARASTVAPAAGSAALATVAAPATVAGLGSVMLVGGGSDQDDVMSAFARAAGAPAAPIVIVPLASSDPAKSGQAYVDYLATLGFRRASFLVPRAEPTPSDRATLAAAGGLFFSGGDQARILAGLTPAWRTLVRGAWQRGAAIGGTSAGAMVWGASAIMGGDPMATGWYGEDPAKDGIRLAPGLGLLPRLVADTHFAERGRLPRLAYAVARHGGVGIGCDPETAVIVRADGHLAVIGRGTVTVLRTGAQPIKAPLSLHDLRVDLLSAGDGLEVGPLGADAP